MLEQKQLLLIGTLVLLTFGLGVNGLFTTNTGVNKVFDDSSNLADNSVEQSQTASQKNTDTSLNENSQETKGGYNVSYNQDSKNWEFKSYTINSTTNTTTLNNQFNVSNSKLKDYITLKSGQTIKHYWFNKNYDLNGFNKNFEAYLIYDNNLNNYKLIYSIGNNVFSINDLKEFNGDENIKLTFNGAYSPARTIGNSKLDKVLVKSYTNDITTHLDLVSLITYNLSDIHILTQSVSGCFYGNKYMSVNKFSDDDIRRQGYCYETTTKTERYSVNDINKYSKDSISQIKPLTRTTNLDRFTFTKQEMSSNYNQYDNKYIKFINNKDFKDIIDYNKDLLSDFTLNIISKNIDYKNFNYDNTFQIGTNEYSFNDFSGLVSQGGTINSNNVINGSVIGVEQYTLNTKNHLGLQMGDNGVSILGGEQTQGFGFGKFYNNFDIHLNGRLYMIEPSIWDRAYGVLQNIVTFDFSGVSQYWNNYVDNPNLIDMEQTGDIQKNMLLYQIGFKKSNYNQNGITNTKPLEQLLTYNGKNYWLFYTLENTNGNKGCLIFDEHINDLDVRMSVSVCSDIIAGVNSVSQFKISSNTKLDI